MGDKAVMEKACPGRAVMVGKLEALQVCCLPESLERRAKPVMRTTLSPHFWPIWSRNGF